MKASELREKSVEELQSLLQDFRKDQFNFRIGKAAGELGQVHLIGEVKKDIARVKTVLTEMKAAEPTGPVVDKAEIQADTETGQLDQQTEQQQTEQQQIEQQQTEQQQTEQQVEAKS